ncbi:MAG: HD domain-containing phosphohydrolase [Planctomycetota bacterium]
MSADISKEGTASILVVDDDRGARQLLSELVQQCGWQAELAEDGFEALAKMKLGFDAVLLDVNLPGIDGYEVARRMTEENEQLPIIMVTGQDSHSDRLQAVEAGAADFIAKPVNMTELQVRVSSQLEKKEALDQLKQHQAHLEEMVDKRTAALRETMEELANSKKEVQNAYVETINRLALAAEFKDRGTGFHIERVSRCTGILAEKCGIDTDKIEVVRYASYMHDVGKVGIPDDILLKPGKLEEKEWETMKTHTKLGQELLSGSSSEILQMGALIAEYHHERWDGSGYPHGLKGEDIPIEGRICTFADVFDALISDRPYRKALSVDKALNIMQEEKGTHFDPHLFDVFEANLDEILEEEGF